MKHLLKIGNLLFGFLAMITLSNSLTFYFENIFYEPISVFQRGIYLFICVLVVFLYLYYLLKQGECCIPRETYSKIKLLCFFLMILWQVTLLVSMPIVPTADPKVIYQLAIGEINPEIEHYISTFPNNYLMLIWEKTLQAIFGTKYLIHALIFFNIVFLDSAILMLQSLVKKVSPISSSILFYFTVFFLGFSPQFLQAYTDIPAFFLGTLILFLGYKLSVEQRKWSSFLLGLFLGVVIAISYGIRAPLFIYIIARFLTLFISLILNKKIVKKNLVFRFILISFGFLITHSFVQYSLNHQDFVPYDSEKSKTLVYFIDLGLTSGGANHAELTEEVREAEGKEKNRIYLDSIKKRVSKMTFNDWSAHLTEKFYNISAEGTMGWQREATLREENLIPNRWSGTAFAGMLRRKVLVNFTDFYRYSLPFQLLWIIISIGLLCYSLSFRYNNHPFHLWNQVIIFGGLAFLLIFEGGRSRYLIQFLPAILWTSSIGYTNLIRKIRLYVK